MCTRPQIKKNNFSKIQFLEEHPMVCLVWPSSVSRIRMEAKPAWLLPTRSLTVRVCVRLGDSLAGRVRPPSD